MPKLYRHVSLVTAAVVGLGLAVSGSGYAKQLGGQAGAFLWMGLGADRVGMGDCGAAMTGGGTAWYYNPAALPYSTGRRVAFEYRMMALDRKIMYAGFSTPFEPEEGMDAGVAVGVMRAGTDEIDGRDSNGERFDMLSYSDNLIHGSFALKPHPRVAVGISIKWLIGAVPDIKENDENLYAYGMGVDIGLLVFARKDLRFGLQVRDLNARYSWDTSEVWGEGGATKEDAFPNLTRLGVAWEVRPSLTVAADAVVNGTDIGEDIDAVEPRFGVEWGYDFDRAKGLVLRAGYNGEGETFGLGLKLELSRVKARLDYAFLVEPVAPSGTHLIGWVFEL